MKAVGFFTSSGQSIKKGKLVAELLNAIKQPKQLAIFEIPGHSKGSTMVAKGNHFANGAVRQMALNSQVIQIGECSLLSINYKILSFAVSTDSYGEEKRIWQQKGKTFDPKKQI